MILSALLGLGLGVLRVVSADDQNVVTLTLCVLIERNTTGKNYDYNRGAAAIDMAMEFAQSDVLPPGYRLEKIYRDLGDECSPKTHIVATAMSLVNSGIKCAAYIGPGCGYAAESLCDVAEYYDLVIIGVPAAGVGLSASVNEYKRICRASITFSMVTDTWMHFFKVNNYTSPTFFTDESFNFFLEMGTITKTTVGMRNFELYAKSFWVPFNGATATSESIRELLISASHGSRGKLVGITDR